jgi:acyl carrier protein
MENVEKKSEDIRKIILKALHLIAPEVDLELLDVDASLRQELDIDSVDFIRLMLLLHEQFKIDIPEADYGKLVSLKSCIAYFYFRLK